MFLCATKFIFLFSFLCFNLVFSRTPRDSVFNPTDFTNSVQSAEEDNFDSALVEEIDNENIAPIQVASIQGFSNIQTIMSRRG